MPTDHIRYDVLARDALRGVLRRVLTDAAAHGLPGDHHFFITFLSRADGVKISPRLLAQYPDEMTIILQHQFWDLVVTEDRFEVGLSFGGTPERLVVPFAAIKGFFDPSVQFGLQFEPTEAEADGDALVTDAVPAPGNVSSGSQSASGTGSPTRLVTRSETRSDPGSDDTSDGSEPTKPSEGAEVVRLDRFRKK